MKLMYPYTYADSIVASSENGNFPVSALEDDYVGNLWKATDTTAVLTVQCAAGANCVALFNTNATSITVEVSGWEAIDWEKDPTRAIDWDIDATRAISWNALSDGIQTELYDISASDIGNLWAEYSITGNLACTMTITLSGSENIYAGVLRLGVAREFRDPAPGIGEGLRDYSIRKELNSGGFYTRKRPSAREFSFQVVEDRDTDFYRFLYDYARVIGPTPIPWRIMHQGSSEWEWVLFASFDRLPRGRHDYPKDSVIDVDLIESI